MRFVGPCRSCFDYVSNIDIYDELGSLRTHCEDVPQIRSRYSSYLPKRLETPRCELTLVARFDLAYC